MVREGGGALHRVTLRAGRVVAVQVAGRFDPLLDALRRQGALDGEGWHAVLEAMARSELPAGQLATQVGGVPAHRVRATLEAQLRDRLRALLRRSLTHGTEAWLSSRPVPPSEGATSLTVLEALPVTVQSVENARRAGRRLEPGPGPAGMRPRTGHGPRPTRADLRRLALTLHPDRHPHLGAEARAKLERRLAEATAAFHGLS